MMVRDLLNVAFILVLLFSAFSTIFQVERYSYKKLLLNLVLMALLVNFSFPIARVIIDSSNVLMYSLINRMTYNVGEVTNGTAKQAIGAMAFGSQYAKMLDVKIASLTYLISAIIFGFILAITFLAIGVMFIIRMVALAILIIFSPVAFVAAIIPGATSYSSKWWNSLFKYAFFGPIMIFMLYISSALIIQIGSTPTMRGFQQQAINQTSAASDAGIIAAISFYSIPIVILWFGLGLAQSMGIAGAGAVMGAAQKVSKGAGKKFSGYNAVSKRYGAYKKERDKRADSKLNKSNLGATFGEKANRAQDSIIAALGGKGAESRLTEMERKKIQEIREEWKKMGGASEQDITNGLNSPDSARKKAAALEAAEKVGFNVGDGKNEAANLAQYQKAAEAFKNDPVLRKMFDDKVKEKHIKFVIEDEVSESDDKSEGNVNAIYKKHLDGLTADDFAKQKGLHENIAKNTSSGARFQSYIRNNIATDTEHHKEIFKKLSREQRAGYQDAGLAPDMKKTRLKSDNSPLAKERFSQEKWDQMTDH